MTVTVTLLTSGGDPGNKSSYTTASISPGANKLILAFCISTQSAVPNAPDMSLSGGGMTTWTQILDSGTSARWRVEVFRALDASPGSGAVTITMSAGSTNCVWSIVEIDGIDTSGTNGSGAVAQAVMGAYIGGNTPKTATFPTSPTGVVVAAGEVNNATAGLLSAGTGFTQIDNSTSTTPDAQLTTAYADPGVDPVFTVSSSATGYACGVEVVAAAPSTTPVSDTWQTSWNVNAQISDAWQTIWNTLAVTSDSWQTSWNTLKQLSDSWQTSWLVNAQISDSWQTSWHTRAYISDAWQTSWNVLAVISDSWQTSWNVASGVPVSDTWQTSWLVNAQISDSWQTSWNVAGPVSDVWQTSWNTLAIISDSWQTSWNVKAIISDLWQTSWNIAAALLDSWQTSWNITGPVSDAWQTSWHVRAYISDSWQTSWSILTVISDAWQTSWNILILVADNWQTSWHVRAYISDSWTTSWHVLYTFAWSEVTNGVVSYTEVVVAAPSYAEIAKQVSPYVEGSDTTIWIEVPPLI